MRNPQISFLSYCLNEFVIGNQRPSVVCSRVDHKSPNQLMFMYCLIKHKELKRFLKQIFKNYNFFLDADLSKACEPSLGVASDFKTHR